MTDYERFLLVKSQMAPDAGFAPIWVPDFLFDFQKALVEWAVRKGRAAILADCGLGKTPCQLVWAENVVRHTNGRVLVLTPLAVAQQTVREADKFGVEATLSRDGRFPGQARIVVTNYDQLHHFDANDFAGVVCDESSILKAYDGATRKAITRFLSKRPYRLLCTATAAPNDYTELGTSSEALGELSYSDMLRRFFAQLDDKGQAREQRKQDEAEALIASNPSYYKKLAFRVSQTIGQWRLKHHAIQPFWRWVASWARALRKPSDLGYDDGPFLLPPLEERDHVIKPETPAPGWLFDLPAVGMHEERQERKRTLEQRCGYVADLVNHDRPAVVWCHTNDEGNLLTRLIPGAEQVAGRTPDERKIELYQAFADRTLRVLVIKPKIGAWGLNWQHCSHVVTFPSHCYDSETELLTVDGWKTFDKISIGDTVGTINPDNLFFEWQKATDHVWSPYSGDMILFAGRAYELLVTPNHRMWSRRDPSRYPGSSGVWEINTAEELASDWKRQCRTFQAAACGWSGFGEDVVHVPSCSSVDYSKSRTRRVGSIPADVFASLAGWYLSEGCIITRNGVIDGRIVICQTDKHPQNRERIIATLRATGLPVNDRTKDISINSKELAHFLASEMGLRSANMRIPRWLKDWPVNRLRILWDAIMGGDGMHSDGTLRGLKSTSSRLIADCQEIGFKLGISCTDRSSAGNYLGIRSRYSRPAIVNRPERVPYSGMVGCVTVPNGLLVVRRNGHPIVSGNSYEQYYQSVRRCWRFGQNNSVRLDVVATEGEVRVLDNMRAKARKVSMMFDVLVSEMDSAVRIERQNDYTATMEAPSWL